MNRIENICRELLSTWSESLLKTQISIDESKRADGALICPACGKIHGRCMEAMYPFLKMAELTKDDKWLSASEKLFDWSENTVSLPDGGYINDIDSDWKGISIFIILSFLDCLEFHSDIMGEAFRKKLIERTRKGAEYLYRFEAIKNKNTNYPVSMAYALYRCGKYFSDDRYIQKSGEYEEIVKSVFLDSYLVYGEGFDREKRSDKNLLAIDVGYNVEETLPAVAKLGLLKNDKSLIELAVNGYRAHLDFMLSDGGWDNSFGTRNLKWTYWGSRTSDGAAEGLLLLSQYDRSFAYAALKNLELMKKCTSNGLLAGGPDYNDANQPECIHHAFTHAKVLASILDNKLYETDIFDTVLPRYMDKKIEYIKNIDSYIYKSKVYTATINGFDWPYMECGHSSGGMISLLHFDSAGPVIASSMDRYIMREKNNMQVPTPDVRHESLDVNIRYESDGNSYSSRNCYSAKLEKFDDRRISVRGFLSSSNWVESDIPYQMEYEFIDNGIQIKAVFGKGELILPILSRKGEDVSIENNKVIIKKDKASIVISRLDEEEIVLPYSTERIFNLVPGFEALKLVLRPKDGEALIKIELEECNA